MVKHYEIFSCTRWADETEGRSYESMNPINQNIVCSVLIRDIYLTWTHDVSTFLRGLAERGMELDLTQSNAVAALMETPNGELTLKELEQTIHRSQSAVARMAAHLSENGYVTIRPDTQDGRVKRVQLTEQGKQCGAYMVELVAKAEKQLLQGISPEEQQLLQRMLQRMLQNSQQNVQTKESNIRDGERKHGQHGQL